MVLPGSADIQRTIIVNDEITETTGQLEPNGYAVDGAGRVITTAISGYGAPSTEYAPAMGSVYIDRDDDEVYVLTNGTSAAPIWTNVFSKAVSGGVVVPFTNADLIANILTVAHFLGESYPDVSIYDNNGLIIIPDDIDNTNDNTCSIALQSFGTISGTWHATILASKTSIGSSAVDSGLKRFEYFYNTGTQTWDTTTATDLIFDTAVRSNPNFSSSGTEISVGVDDEYSITADVTLYVDNADNIRTSVNIWMELNGIEIAGTRGRLYLRQNDFGATATIRTVQNLVSSDVITVVAQRSNGSSGMTQITNGTRLEIRKEFN